MTQAISGRIRELIGVLGAVESAIEDSDIIGLSATERGLVDAALRDAQQTIAIIGAMLETVCAPIESAANGS